MLYIVAVGGSDNNMKKCSKCKENLPLSMFYVQNGRPSSYCKKCEREYHREYQKSSKYREWVRNYRKNSRSGKDKRNEYQRSEKYKIWKRNWRKSELQKAKEKEYRNSEKHKEWVKNNLGSKLRSRLNSAIRGGQKSGSAVDDLGCSIENLKLYLESKFQEGMTWDNRGKHGWHIDHIKPLSSFDLTDREQFLKAVNYTNLQPLWAKDNLTKGVKIL